MLFIYLCHLRLSTRKTVSLEYAVGVMNSSPKQKALAFKSSPYFSGYKDTEGLPKRILRKRIVLKKFSTKKITLCAA